MKRKNLVNRSSHFGTLPVRMMLVTAMLFLFASMNVFSQSSDLVNNKSFRLNALLECYTYLHSNLHADQLKVVGKEIAYLQNALGTTTGQVNPSHVNQNVASHASDTMVREFIILESKMLFPAFFNVSSADAAGLNADYCHMYKQIDSL